MSPGGAWIGRTWTSRLAKALEIPILHLCCACPDLALQVAPAVDPSTLLLAALQRRHSPFIRRSDLLWVLERIARVSSLHQRSHGNRGRAVVYAKPVVEMMLGQPSAERFIARI